MKPERLKFGRDLERDVLRQIYKYLQDKRYWFSRLQNVEVWDEKKRKYMRKGLPDFICFKENSERLFGGKMYPLIAIEVKREKGKHRSGQKGFMKLWKRSVNKYILARNLDDLIRSGL